MNGNLMDTNVIVRVLNGDRELINELSKISSLCTCTVVLGELMYGAAKSAHVVQNKQNAKSFCSRYPLLGVSNIVAEFYGEIKKDLLSHGNVMPENEKINLSSEETNFLNETFSLYLKSKTLAEGKFGLPNYINNKN